MIGEAYLTSPVVGYRVPTVAAGDRYEPRGGFAVAVEGLTTGDGHGGSAPADHTAIDIRERVAEFGG